jgi:hypothetical protein
MDDLQNKKLIEPFNRFDWEKLVFNLVSASFGRFNPSEYGFEDERKTAISDSFERLEGLMNKLKAVSDKNCEEFCDLYNQAGKSRFLKAEATEKKSTAKLIESDMKNERYLIGMMHQILTLICLHYERKSLSLLFEAKTGFETEITENLQPISDEMKYSVCMKE